MKTIDTAVAMLLVLAGLNCGLIALFQYDFFTTSSPAAGLTRLFFGLVGVAAIYRLITLVMLPAAAPAVSRHVR